MLMSDTESKNALLKKIQQNYDSCLQSWLNQDAEYLIAHAEEIVATKGIVAMIEEYASSENVDYFIRFENPLKVLCDKWMEENGNEFVQDEGFADALWFLRTTECAEQDYPLDEQYSSSGYDKGVTMC